MRTNLVVELGEPVVERHLAGAPDYQLPERHLHTFKLSAKYVDIEYTCFKLGLGQYKFSFVLDTALWYPYKD